LIFKIIIITRTAGQIGELLELKDINKKNLYPPNIRSNIRGVSHLEVSMCIFCEYPINLGAPPLL
jgi:hypothetical protein